MDKKYRVRLVFDDGEEVEDDVTFNTEEEAEKYGEYLLESYDAGGSVLHMSNPGDYPGEWEEPIIDVYDD